MKFIVTFDRNEEADCRRMSISPRMCKPGQDRARGASNIEDVTKQCLEVRAERGMPLTLLYLRNLTKLN